MDHETLTITNLSHDGRGITHLNGKTIFVANALVGEEVTITIQKQKSRFDEAIIDKIMKPSPERQLPQCGSFGVCGGCSLQHMNSHAQIRHKEAVLLEQLQHIGHIVPTEILPAVTSSPYEYRRKARLGVRYVIKKEKLLIGFREKNGRYLADISECPVLHPTIGRQLDSLKNFLMQLEGYLQIPQLEIAVGDETTAIILRHLAPLSVKDGNAIKQFAIDHHFQIYLQPGGPQTAALFYPEQGPARLAYKLDHYDITIQFHPTDFVQVNHEINQKLISQALKLLAPQSNEMILDLFCGLGNFTLPIAKYSKKVLGIEGCQLMVERGYENARLNNIHNVEFQCQNLADDNYTYSWVQEPIDGILLDPPRTGAWEIVQHIPKTTANRLVYVSCNPATLARDAGFLTQHGFHLQAVGVLDMFPHTSHVESIALFTR